MITIFLSSIVIYLLIGFLVSLVEIIINIRLKVYDKLQVKDLFHRDTLIVTTLWPIGLMCLMIDFVFPYLGNITIWKRK
jgi:hypothetical protein